MPEIEWTELGNQAIGPGHYTVMVASGSNLRMILLAYFSPFRGWKCRQMGEGWRITHYVGPMPDFPELN